MLKKQQISLSCPVCFDSKIVFDTDLSIIPCNGLSKIIYGKLDENFDTNKINELMDSADVKHIKKQLKTIPSIKCIDCDKNNICNGGCITHYTHWSLDEILEMKNAKY